MTSYRFVTLTCDGCGQIHDDGQSTRVGNARGTAAAEGWRHRRGVGPNETGPGPGRHLDFCPKCVPLMSGIGWTDRKATPNA